MAVETVRVELKEHSYDILIGSGVRHRVKELIFDRMLTVTDSTVNTHYGSWINAAIGADFKFIFPAGENSKTPVTAIDICRYAAQAKFDRKSCFAAVGGGVTGDLTGFAAAIFMRGVNFIQIPTTLLAMVDSSIGGKTGVDIPEGKNLVGAFHQPKLVLIDPDFLATLPPREIRCGLAEIIKTALILDKDLFDKLEHHSAEIVSGNAHEILTSIIRRCCELKASVVAADERENGLRAILNYGHTFGHAIEIISDFSFSHGDSIAIGMNAAAELAVNTGILSRAEANRQKALLQAVGLPVDLPRSFPLDKIIGTMEHDKKNANGKIKTVIIDKIGHANVIQPPREAIIKAIEAIYA